jgi:protein-S-isoprenylcysteine O-methyltransferase Ste14
MPINRIVALLTAILGVAGAVMPALTNMDWQSTAGVIAGLGVAAAAALKWLEGWQAHELHQAIADEQPNTPDAGP